MRSAVILAAGKGTRMQSAQPKVLHQLLGKSMIQHIIATLKEANITKIIVVLGHKANVVKEHLQHITDIEFVEQAEQLGTAHALLQTKNLLASAAGNTIVVCGDTPLLTSETIEKMFYLQEQKQAACTILTGVIADATGYGRIVRDEQKTVIEIVEEKEASVAQKQIQEFNAGTYCFRNEDLFSLLHKISNNNAQAEYYLPDMIALYREQAAMVESYVIEDIDEIMGINDRVALNIAEKIMQQRINKQWQTSGVTMHHSESIFIGPDVILGKDVTLEQNVQLLGQTIIGNGVMIGMNTEIVDSQIGDYTTIKQSVITESIVGANSTIGPFAHLRANAKLGNTMRIGNFVEIKNSSLNDNTNAAHLAYIGDSEVGQRVNIGCGAITVNYNGVSKSKTIIKDDAFIGCNVNLLAPVTISEHAIVAAGSTVNKDVPADALAIAREHQVIKNNYGKKLKALYRQRKEQEDK